MYLKLKQLAETMRCHIAPLELLHIMRDHWKRPDTESHDITDANSIESYFVGILRHYIPEEVSDALTTLIFEDISTNKEFTLIQFNFLLTLLFRMITVLDIQKFHKKYNIKVKPAEIRKIVNFVDQDKDGKISYDEFHRFLLDWK